MTDRIADRGAMAAHFDGQGSLMKPEPPYEPNGDDAAKIALMFSNGTSVIAIPWKGTADQSLRSAGVMNVSRCYLYSFDRNLEITQDADEAVYLVISSEAVQTKKYALELTVSSGTVPASSPGEIEPWMAEKAPDARFVMKAEKAVACSEALPLKLAHPDQVFKDCGWSLPFAWAPEEIREKVRLIASADGQPLPEVE